MSFFNQQGLTAEQFLRDYWQQQPLLLRQAFPDFEPELDADDIAGLACDELAEARLITGGFPQQRLVRALWPVQRRGLRHPALA